MRSLISWRGCFALTLLSLNTALLSSAQTASCAEASSQFDLNRCAGVGFKHADAELNKIYVRALAGLSSPSRVRLREAQRAWVNFRDKQCAFESNGVNGGSVAPMVWMNCATGLTTARTRALASIGKCEEGDVSCAR